MLRHSTAHLLAYAVKELFPDAQVTIGPVIEDGFYYDFSYKRPFTPEDIAAIEKRMRELAKRDEPVTRTPDAARRGGALFRVASASTTRPRSSRRSRPTEPISLYSEGAFTDLCRGPHVPSTGRLKVFKLTKLAGAYWRGDSKNEMLQRIYGTAWAKKEDLDAYLHRIEEAEKRDHRKLGRQLDLFHLQDEAPGMVFWHPKGWSIWQQVEQYMRRVYRDNGYQEVRCPQILDRSLWEKSGHWENYKDNMFTTESEKRDFAIKPMNCPGPRPDLQLRPAQLPRPAAALRRIRLLPPQRAVRRAARADARARLHAGRRPHLLHARPDPAPKWSRSTSWRSTSTATSASTTSSSRSRCGPTPRLGSDEQLGPRRRRAARRRCEPAARNGQELPGEGAFYGPKIEYHLKDSLGRSWQCGTMQVDFQMPGAARRRIRRRRQHAQGAR